MTEREKIEARKLITIHTATRPDQLWGFGGHRALRRSSLYKVQHGSDLITRKVGRGSDAGRGIRT